VCPLDLFRLFQRAFIFKGDKTKMKQTKKCSFYELRQRKLSEGMRRNK